MKTKIIIFFLFSFFSFCSFAQVGIGNTNPTTTLEVTGEPNSASILDGIIVPRISGDQLKLKNYTINQEGCMIFVTAPPTLPQGQVADVNQSGYYYFDGTKWNLMGVNTVSDFDELIQYNGIANRPTTGVIGKLYIDETNGETYTWNGTNYVNPPNIKNSSFNFSGTSLDSGTDKTSAIQRNGSIGVGLGANGNVVNTVDINGSVGKAIKVLTTNYTATNTDFTMIFNGTNLTCTIPAAAAANTRRIYTIVNINSTNLTVSGSLNGITSLSIAQNASLTIQSNGTTWFIVNKDGSSFFIQGSTADAFDSKTANIYRQGGLLLATQGSSQTTQNKSFHIQGGGNSVLTSSFGDGMLFSTNSGAGCRFFLEHLGAGTDQKTSVIYNQFGITYLGAILNDSGNTWLRSSPISVRHSNGYVGINTTLQKSNLEVSGSYGAAITTVSSALTLDDTHHTVVATGTFTVTLPTPNSSTNAMRMYNLKNGGTGTITISGHIDNVASSSITLSAGQSARFHCNGSTWWRL